MENYYDILGVARDASPEDIRNAWRAKRGELHPDREGGSNEAMAELNAAYDALSDPDKRAAYDETMPDPERDAMRMLESVLDQAIQSQAMDCIATAKKMLSLAKEEGDTYLRQATGSRDRIAKRRAKVFRKSGPNLVHTIIDRMVKNLELSMEATAKRIAVVVDTQHLLEEYSSTEAEPDLASGSVTTADLALAAQKNIRIQGHRFALNNPFDF